jgi:hypothetical protein
MEAISSQGVMVGFEMIEDPAATSLSLCNRIVLVQHATCTSSLLFEGLVSPQRLSGERSCFVL